MFFALHIRKESGMKKRLIALIICAAMLLTLFPYAAAAGKYDPKPAIAWATNKKSFEAYDGKCSSFVSACFRKGGLSDVKESVVGDLMNYIEKKKYGTIVTANDTNLKKLKPGDAIAVACSKKHGSSYYGKHVIFVVSVDQKNKKITYCAKNNDRFKLGMSFSSIKSYDNNWNKGKCSKCGASLKTYLILMENVEPRTAGTLQFYGNYSGKNYLYQGDFSGTLDADYYFSRDTSVSKLSIDGSTRHDGFPSLKIVNTSAGSSGKDLCIKTLTNQCRNNYSVGDSKNMTLSFWAKSSVDGNTFCVRWGFQSDYKTVKLSKDWTRYTVSLPKTTAYNNCLHPYVGKAGTVWMTQMQLEDGTAATDYVS